MPALLCAIRHFTNSPILRKIGQNGEKACRLSQLFVTLFLLTIYPVLKSTIMNKTLLCSLALATSLGASAAHTIQAERLDRGVIAVKTESGVFLSWRSLVTDDKSLTFDVYRDGVKINESPIDKCTNYTDHSGNASSKYVVKALLGNEVKESSDEITPWSDFYKKVHLNRPEGGTSPAGGAHESRNYTYTPDDVSVGDVDGDGQWELIVKWFPTNAADNSHYRYTGNTILDCYKLDGTQLWRIDLGINIRSGNHYTQFMVYDFDGNGKAELMCKTAPGTVDGQGKHIVLNNDDPNGDYRRSDGQVISGPEYLTVFNGETGAEIQTIPYNPPRSIRNFAKGNLRTDWGDNYGGRSERYLATVAYLDGQHPSAVFCRGYYTASYVWALDFDGTHLTERWLHKSEEPDQGLFGEGAHGITVGDVDGDGCDEIVYGAASLDHDGTLLYRTGANHGDALHLTDMLPDRDGLEVFMPHESKILPWDTELRDARTGEIIYGRAQSGKDIGRGVAANISSKWRGYEYWAAGDASTYNNGVAVSNKCPSMNFRVYWDGDLLDELLDGTTITKPNEAITQINTIASFGRYSNAAACNGTKNTPNLQADLFGDWREEVILHDGSTQSDLIIFTTTSPSPYKVPTLMQDRQYRLAIAWQNVAYNQPPHLGYNLEETFDIAGAISITEGDLNQLVNYGDAIEPIRFVVKRADGVVTNNLPEGLTLDFNKNTLTGTISGVPAKEGEFNYTLSTTGNPNNDNITLEGTIKVVHSLELTALAQYAFEVAGTTTPNKVYGTATVNGTSSLAQGKKGNAFAFDGNTTITQPGYEPFNLGFKDFTIEAWISSTDNDATLLKKGNSTTLGLNNGELCFTINDGAESTTVKTAAGKYLDGTWHHIVGVRNAYEKQMQLYVDGELAAQAAEECGSLNCAAEVFTMGENLNGLLDEVAVFSGAMTADKVQERFLTTGKELARYTLDELGDSTPNTVFGEATPSASGLRTAAGKKNGAVEFNNSAYLVQPMYDSMIIGESDFTAELWFKSTDADAYLFCFGSHYNNAANGTTGTWIGLERKNGYLCFTIDDDSQKTDCKLADANSYFDGEWHHVACVRDYAAKMMTLYVDGDVVATANSVRIGALNSKTSEFIYIGGDDESGNRPFEGTLDELAVYPEALTAEEVKAKYEALKDMGVADLRFTDASHFIVVDAFSGRIVRTVEAENESALTDGLEKGIYIIVARDGNATKSYKYIKHSCFRHALPKSRVTQLLTSR